MRWVNAVGYWWLSFSVQHGACWCGSVGVWEWRLYALKLTHDHCWQPYTPPPLLPTTSTPLPRRSLAAYSLSKGGSDWCTIQVLRVDPSGAPPTPLADKLEYVKFSSLAWTHDQRGFFYNRYPDPASRPADLGTETDSNTHQQLCYHALGTPQVGEGASGKLRGGEGRGGEVGGCAGGGGRLGTGRKVAWVGG